MLTKSQTMVIFHGQPSTVKYLLIKTWIKLHVLFL